MTEVPLRRPLEPFDELMLRAESDPRTRSTLTGVFVLDRVPEWDRVVAHWERVTRLVLPLRQRVVSPALPLARPVWVVDPDFDLAYHLRRVQLPAPGTLEQLLAWLEPSSLAPMDTARPLWESTLVERLEGGRAAWVTRMHHAVADGVGGQALARLAFDFERDPAPEELPPIPPPEDVTPVELVRGALRHAPLSVATTAVSGARAAVRVAEHVVKQPRGSVEGAVSYLRSLRRMVSGPGTTPSPLLAGRSLQRRLLVLDVGLEELRTASRTVGGSLNDGFVAAVCGGLRRYHEQLDSPVEDLPAAMPINTRTGNDPLAGNRWAGARLSLPVADVDPGERIRRIGELVKAARDEPALNAFSALAPVAVQLPSWLLSLAAGDAVGGSDVQVSNVPGSPVPLYLAGAEVLEVYPFGPVPGPAAMITLHSYRRRCFVGINLDPAAVTDPGLFLRCLQEGVDEVLALGRTP